MKKKLQITGKTFAITAAVGIILIMLSLVINTIWAFKQTVSATDEAVSAVSSFYLEAMADRRAKTITNLINNNFDYMGKALDVIGDADIDSQEELRESIGMITKLLSLSRFAMVDDDNIVYTQYTTYTGGTRHEFLSGDVMDDRVISTVYLYGSSRQLCLAVPTDMTIMGRHFKACFVQIDIKDIVDLLAFDDQGKTQFALYSMNGGNLSDTELGPVIGTRNLFEAMKNSVPDEDISGISADFADEAGGSLTFTIDGNAETMCYVPVEGTGWEMAVLIRESVIYDQIHEISDENLKISRYQIIFTLMIVLLFAAILLLQLRSIARSRLEAEREKSRNLHSMANTDSMTGVRNKHAFIEMEANLNTRIRENDLDKLAVLVCDINGLKTVNDTQGHAAGDKLIKDAAELICERFTHGAVYRIGGGEFVVILQGKGYDSMAEVLDEINRTVEENIGTGNVVIAIGYSVLNETDEQVHDVFERADQKMYARKQELKAMGAKTRE